MTDLHTAPKPHLVVLALFELGGEADLEAIAVKAFEMFPTLFSWKSYPEYPDKDVVRVHLSDAKKEQFGGLVEDKDLRRPGDRSRGRTKRYALTQAGIARARALKSIREVTTVTAQPTSINYRRVIEPIIRSSAFVSYQNGETIQSIGRQGFLESLKLFPDATGFMIGGRLARAETLIDSVPDKSMQESLSRYIRAGRECFDL